jgi:hypothetical protein
MSSAKALKKFGIPGGKTEGRYMTRWKVPADIQKAFSHVKFSDLGTIGFPKVIYCNNAMVAPLEKALRNLMAAGLAGEMITWDGCYIVRKGRGLKSYSMHAWGLAIDLNRKDNDLGMEPALSPEFVACFTSAGFLWGGSWKRKDGMHFELVIF